VSVMDRPLSGPEAAALYHERMQELHEVAERERRQRTAVIRTLDENGGRATIQEVMDKSGFGIREVLPILNDLLSDGRMLAQGTVLVLPQSPGSTP